MHAAQAGRRGIRFVVALWITVLFVPLAWAAPAVSLVKDIMPGRSGSAPEWLTGIDGTLYFTAKDREHGYELWRSDGTAIGTVMVKDIRAGPRGSEPYNLAALGGTLYFQANDGIGFGYELWKSDGTEAGTTMVKDIVPGMRGSYPSWLTASGRTLYFTVYNEAYGEELWKSDGTEAGTVLVKDIWPGSDGTSPNGSHPEYLVDVSGTLYFTAHDGVNGGELWKSDGTAAGTVMVKDIRPGSGGSSCSTSVVRGRRSTSTPTTAATASSSGRATAPRPAR